MRTASIYSIASDDPVRAETIAWARFSAAQDSAEFCSSWLAILCTQIDQVDAAILLLGPDDNGAFAPAAVWPDPTIDLRHLGPTGERVLVERKAVVVAADGQPSLTHDQAARVGYPIEVAGVIRGAVVLEVAPRPEAALQRSLRLVHWASCWLIDMIRQRSLEETKERLGRTALAMGMVATAVNERRLSSSALAVANELAVRMNCDRVSVGLERSGAIEPVALSHTASFNPRMGLVRLLGAAMDEVLDLDATVVLPPQDDAPPGTLAHADLARDQRDTAICSVPMRDDNRTIGVVTLERTNGINFDAETVELCETVAGLLGPIVSLKQETERGALLRIGDFVRRNLGKLVGPSHPGMKLIALSVLALALFFSVFTTSYRVSARAVVEGSVQRAAVAPFDGHIAESDVRAGDIVHAGQVLCRLDDRDLRLELTRLTSERDQARGKHKQSLATQDRASMVVLAAQVAELDAQIALIEDRLARATLVAPFDGIVVSGDLSQLLDTPVEQGKLLFQIAPLASYRVILEVDERDISTLRREQSGDLMLSGLPGQRMPFTVEQITPVSTSQEGRNFFRVEAHLIEHSDRLRPGMEGVGKVEVGQRRLIWVWTHGLVDWFRVFAWRELP